MATSLTSDKSKRKYFKVWDLAVILVVVLVALLGIFPFFSKGAKEGSIAVVRLDGEVYAKVKLSEVTEPYEISVATDNGEVVVQITPEGACVKESPCKDKLCVNTGVVSKAGRSSVCLPERVSVQIVLEDTQNLSVDAVAG